ncbi:hypothetical protein [Sphingomonas sp. YL-JM2C]
MTGLRLSFRVVRLCALRALAKPKASVLHPDIRLSSEADRLQGKPRDESSNIPDLALDS